MDRKLSDEQLDRIAENLVKDFALRDEQLDEIAASPKLWWSVKNRIEAEKARREKSWFAFALWPVPVFGALALMIFFGLTALYFSSKTDPNEQLAKAGSVQISPPETVRTPKDSPVKTSNADSDKSPSSQKSNPVLQKLSVKTPAPKAEFAARNPISETSARLLNNSPKKEALPKKTEETKTDFIALSYAANTESGQIVRVKVPSSMMVSLGVATNVEKESELVSAEVIIGDDGLARAIRFIR
jgi:hypothetical protein